MILAWLVCSLTALPGHAQELYNYTVSVLGGLGGAPTGWAVAPAETGTVVGKDRCCLGDLLLNPGPLRRETAGPGFEDHQRPVVVHAR